jgi:hypothetical protein
LEKQDLLAPKVKLVLKALVEEWGRLVLREQLVLKASRVSKVTKVSKEIRDLLVLLETRALRGLSERLVPLERLVLSEKQAP